jgi:hypothetical protein
LLVLAIIQPSFTTVCLSLSLAIVKIVKNKSHLLRQAQKHKSESFQFLFSNFESVQSRDISSGIGRIRLKSTKQPHFEG